MDGDMEKQVREQLTLTPNEFLREKNASLKETLEDLSNLTADESESWICNADEGGWSDLTVIRGVPVLEKFAWVWPEICENDGLKNLCLNLWNT